MRLISVGIFLLWFSSTSYAQSSKVYSWEEVLNANPDTIFSISFEKMKLEVLPDQLRRFHKLNYLNLSKNKIEKLPDYIGDFQNLNEIDLGRNKLSNFPIQFCRMKSLKRVILNRNSIEIVPECIDGITNLEYLDLYDCPIKSLPSSLASMKNLKEIDFSGIRFSPTFQDAWLKKLPNVKLVFDPPCDCMD